MIKIDPVDRLKSESIAALVDFLECDSLMDVQILLRDYLFFYIKGDASNDYDFDWRAFEHLASFLDELTKHGLIKEDDLDKEPPATVPTKRTYRKLKSTAAPILVLPVKFSSHNLEDGQHFLYELFRMAMHSPEWMETPKDQIQHLLEMYHTIGSIYEVAHMINDQIKSGQLTFSYTDNPTNNEGS